MNFAMDKILLCVLSEQQYQNLIVKNVMPLNQNAYYTGRQVQLITKKGWNMGYLFNFLRTYHKIFSRHIIWIYKRKFFLAPKLIILICNMILNSKINNKLSCVIILTIQLSLYIQKICIYKYKWWGREVNKTK